jgi:hypothetical protein
MIAKNIMKIVSGFFFIGTITIALVLLNSSKGPAQESKQPQESKQLISQIIPIEIARKAAIHEIENNKLMEEWKGAIASSERPATFFDLYGRPTAYCFKVLKEGQYKGYITISALPSFYPLRDGSTGDFPLTYLDQCKQYAKQKIGDLLERYELIYLGNTFYFVKLFSSSDNVILTLSSHPVTIPQQKLESAQLSLEQKGVEIGQKAKIEWETYIK